MPVTEHDYIKSFMTDEELQRGYGDKIDEHCIVKTSGLNYGLIIEGNLFNMIY
jgi:hypothetical protein